MNIKNFCKNHLNKPAAEIAKLASLACGREVPEIEVKAAFAELNKEATARAKALEIESEKATQEALENFDTDIYVKLKTTALKLALEAESMILSGETPGAQLSAINTITQALTRLNEIYPESRNTEQAADLTKLPLIGFFDTTEKEIKEFLKNESKKK